MDTLFRALYFAGIAVQLIVRAPHGLRRRRIAVEDRRAERVERILLAWLSFAGLAPPAALCATRWLSFADYRVSPRAKVRLGGLGALLLAGSLCLFWRAHRDLGTNWSPSLEINAEQ